jgi:hypothetical protein
MRDELAHFVEGRTAPVADLDIRYSKIRHKQFEVRDLDSSNRVIGN